MAKAPKNESGPGSDAEGSEPDGEAAASAPGASRKLVIFAAAGLLALAALGGGAFMFLKPSAKEEAGTAKKAVAYLDIREMTVNLASAPQQDRPQFLKLKIALEVADPRLVAAITPLLPRIEDAFQVYVRELRPADLEGSAGVYRLKEELLRRVNMAVHPSRIEAVLFKDLVVQ